MQSVIMSIQINQIFIGLFKGEISLSMVW